MELNRQGCWLLSVRRHVSGRPRCRKFGRDTVRAKAPGMKFVSLLDCEGNGHFEELLVTTSHVNDNPARAPSNECIPGD